MTEFNPLQKIKRRFFAMRNGIIADYIRKSGAPYRIIFGLNLPQISEIAAETGKNEDLARELRRNVSTRESLLLAPMLMPAEAMDEADACQWLRMAPSAEVVDVVCMKLIRALPYAPGVADTLINEDAPMSRYAALRLMLNLLPSGLEKAEQAAASELERNEPLTRGLCRQLLDEISFLRGC